jgi:hypothetical protein
VFIKEYFQEIESQISANPYASESRVLKDTRSLHIGIIEGEIMFTNESLLHFIEFVNVKETTSVYKYSYHYQDKNKNLIFRYDMAPHHKELEGFPHHKHIPPNKVMKAQEPTLSKVLDEIDDFITSKTT